MDVTRQLQDIIRNTFAEKELVITREMTAHDVKSWDSVTHIKLIVAIENNFKIKFHMSELVRLKNVGELVDLIEEKKSQ